MELLIIDGGCGFCRACAAWLLARCRRRLLVLDYRDLRLPGRVAAAGRQWLQLSRGRRCDRGSQAMLRACASLRAPWRLLACLLGLPLPLREAVYRLIARHRALLSPACGLQTAAPMDRTVLRPLGAEGQGSDA
jgi:predicted DCC family thiol-disulfide oxidoreductase YuxK